MLAPCFLLVNLDANGGRAAKRWADIAAELGHVLPQASRMVSFRPPENTVPMVKTALEEGFCGFISAGGDGSANFLLNLLMRETGEKAGHLWLGGIGLGSSNDFIKPITHFIHELPTRLNWETAMAVDVGKAVFMDVAGRWQTHYFIANSSMGVTAEANWRFNQGDPFIRFFKNKWTDLAILYTAIRTILTYRNYPVSLTYEGNTRFERLSNLSVLKSPYVSGSFHFDDPVQRDDGLLGVDICLNMSKMELLSTLIGLAKGRFRGRPKTVNLSLRQISVRMASPVALEMDGEVFQATEVHFSLIPKAINLLGL
jgi:diacylglycerol kinase (ATP)